MKPGTGFEEFVRSHHAQLLRFANTLSTDAATATELTEHTLVRLHRRWRSVVTDESPLAEAQVTITRLYATDATTRHRARLVLVHGYGLTAAESTDYLGWAESDVRTDPAADPSSVDPADWAIEDRDLPERVFTTLRSRKRRRLAAAAGVMVAALGTGFALSPAPHSDREDALLELTARQDFEYVTRLVSDNLGIYTSVGLPDTLVGRLPQSEVIASARVVDVSVDGAFSDDEPAIVDPAGAGYQTVALTLRLDRVLKTDGIAASGDTVVAIINVDSEESPSILQRGFGQLGEIAVLLSSGRSWPLADYSISLAGGGIFPVEAGRISAPFLNHEGFEAFLQGTRTIDDLAVLVADPDGMDPRSREGPMAAVSRPR